MVRERDAVDDVPGRPVASIGNGVEIIRGAAPNRLWSGDGPERIGDIPEFGLAKAIGREEVGHARPASDRRARLVPHQPAVAGRHSRVIHLVVSSHSAKHGLRLPDVSGSRCGIRDNDRKHDLAAIGGHINDTEEGIVVIELRLKT